ncbi:MAG: hypothetical protein R2911_07285 [Caldilineaceae bacterium]
MDHELRTMLNAVTFVAPFGLRQKTTVWACLPLARRLHQLRPRRRSLIPPWDSPAVPVKVGSTAGFA